MVVYIITRHDSTVLTSYDSTVCWIKGLLRKGIEYYHVILPGVPREFMDLELSLNQIKRSGGQIWNISNIDSCRVK